MTDDEVVAAVAALAARRQAEDPSADIVAHGELLSRAAGRGDAGGELAHEILTLHALGAHAFAVRTFELHIGPMGRYQPADLDAWLAPLRGRDLACWCAPGLPCHADVLLSAANGKRS